MKENNNKNSVELCVLCGEPEAVILANGDYPTHPIPLQILAYAPYIICCDGGANAYIDRGNVPDVIIGDGDSLSEENRRKYSHILHYIINFGAHNLRGEGLVYPLSDFTNWWQGTLNESTETEFTIHAEGEYLVIMNYLSSPLPPQSTHSDISFR